jgi:heat shock protein HslJ
VPSGSDTRYQAGDALFWSKGDEATLETAAGKYEGCQGQPADAPWDEARLLGIEFRAVGQEPGWVLELDQGRSLRYLRDYGKTEVLAPAPEPIRDSVTATATYRAQSEGRALEVVIREAPCADAMSGEQHSHTVTVRLDQSEVNGCGRTLGAGDLTSVYWKLVELDGRPVLVADGNREPHLRLSADGSAVSGSTGCNGFRGKARIEGEQAKLGPVVSTMMACLDPKMGEQEQRFLRALESADRLVTEGDGMTMYAGEQALARFRAVYLR